MNLLWLFEQSRLICHLQWYLDEGAETPLRPVILIDEVQEMHPAVLNELLAAEPTPAIKSW